MPHGILHSYQQTVLISEDGLVTVSVGHCCYLAILGIVKEILLTRLLCQAIFPTLVFLYLTEYTSWRLKLLAKMDKLETPREAPKAIRMRFGEAIASGNEVLEVKGLSMSFGSKTLFRDVNFLLKSGDPFRKKARATALYRGNVQRTLQAFLPLPDILFRPVHQIQDLIRILQEKLSLFCQGHFMGRPKEQCRPQFRLQILDLTA